MIRIRADYREGYANKNIMTYYERIAGIWKYLNVIN